MIANTRHSHSSSEVDYFHNYYERLVEEEILRASPEAGQDRSFLCDVACVALNHLPPRYIRHNVDMSFFLSPQEYAEIEDKVRLAVSAAISHVQRNRQRD